MTAAVRVALRAAILTPIARATDGIEGRAQDRLLRMGWMQHDPNRPGHLALTVAGAGEVLRLPPSSLAQLNSGTNDGARRLGAIWR